MSGRSESHLGFLCHRKSTPVLEGKLIRPHSYWPAGSHRGGSMSFLVSNQEWLAHSFSLSLFCSFLFFLRQFFLLLLFPSFWPLGPGFSPPARPTTSPQSSQDAVENQPAGIPSWERSSEQFPLFPFQQKETGFDLLCSSATSFSFFTPHTTAVMFFARNKKQPTIGLP